LSAALVLLLFFFSGTAALVYQTAWQRILALGSGVGIYSVAMIVGAFMAGLGIGSHVAGAWSIRLTPRRALLSFAAVEIGIGLFGAFSTVFLYDLLYARAAWLYAAPWRAGVAHFLTLLVPTGLMGMSLPLLVRAVVRDAASASRTIGNLYGVNVLGAATGALLTPWVLVRLLGVSGAVWVAAGANLAVGLSALLLLGTTSDSEAASEALTSAPDAGVDRPGTHPFALWLGLYATSGFVALALEIVWFRIMDVAVKSSAFTFGTLLAIYLLGCGAGALVGARRAPRLRHPLPAFLACQCALLLAAALAVLVPVWFPGTWLAGFHDYWKLYEGVTLGETGATAALLRLYLALPLYLFGLPTFLMGLTFPILQRAVHDEVRTSGRKVGELQAANIAGCVGGSLLVGLVALEHVGTSGTLRGLCLVGVLFAAVGWREGSRRSLFAGLGVLLVAAAAALPSNTALWSLLHGWERKDALLAEDASGVSAILSEGGGQRWRLSVNGKGNSHLPFGSAHSYLGALPALIHRAPEDVALIGLGSGDTAWAAACRRETRSVTVFELLRSQPPLLRELLGRYPYPPLQRLLGDPRLRLVLDDGRSGIEHEGRLYDMIEADALRPRSAGSGNLYSVEFFEACARRLKKRGLVCTWAPTPRVYASFCRVFPHVIELPAAGEPVLVGSPWPIPLDRGAWRARVESPEVSAYLGAPLVRELVAIIRGAKPADLSAQPQQGLNTDLFPRDEFLTPP